MDKKVTVEELLAKAQQLRRMLSGFIPFTEGRLVYL